MFNRSKYINPFWVPSTNFVSSPAIVADQITDWIVGEVCRSSSFLLFRILHICTLFSKTTMNLSLNWKNLCEPCGWKLLPSQVIFCNFGSSFISKTMMVRSSWVNANSPLESKSIDGFWILHSNISGSSPKTNSSFLEQWYTKCL